LSEEEASNHSAGKPEIQGRDKPVLRIHFILMRIRILDPHWKKIDPDPDSGHDS